MLLRVGRLALSLLIVSTSVPALGRAPVPAAAADAPADSLDAGPVADSILGEWWSEGKEGRLKIEKTKSGLFQVVVLDGVDAKKKDVKNPDPKLRDRTVRGMVIMWHLRFEDGEYVDGYCYNPRDGKTYRVKLKLNGGKELRVRGYFAIPLLGQTQTWTRVS
jgi:uncharacterized protein (DUF2147 family)